MLAPGDYLPDFELPSQTGQLVSLSSLRERGHVVLYLYVRDATPF